MPRKRLVSETESDDDTNLKVKKKKNVASTEVITVDSDDDIIQKTPKAKTKKKETQRNTLDKYFFLSKPKGDEKQKPDIKKESAHSASTHESSSGSRKTHQASPTKLTMSDVRQKSSNNTSPKKLHVVQEKPKTSPDNSIKSSRLLKLDEFVSPSKGANGKSSKVVKRARDETKSADHGETDELLQPKKRIRLEEQSPKRNLDEKSGDSKSTGIKKPVEDRQTTPSKISEKTESRATASGASKMGDRKGSNTTPAGGSKMGEKRRSGGGNYLAYLNREGPREIGSKDIPEGTASCLSGLNFVLTGVMEAIERDDAKDLIERCGGKVTTSVSKKTSYLVIGREPGISKTNKAEQLKTKQISEDELFELIRQKSGDSAPRINENETAKVPSDGARENSETQSKYFSTSTAPDAKMTKTKSPPTKMDARSIDTSSSTSAGKPPTQTDQSESSQSLLWVDKYRPRSLKQLIGQQGASSVAQKLLQWLRDWHRHMSNGTKKSGSVGFTRGFRDDGSLFKAALLSGPPGIGKTTTASLVCQELGFSFVELNASDTRSKRSLQEQVSEAVGSHSVVDFLQEAKANTGKRHCLVMDEVDGMAGNEDRGGIGELIQLIKQSKIPIICMCNDRSHQKMRSLVNYCFDLRFQRPRIDQIKAAMMSLAYKEGLNIDQTALVNIITASDNDIRQTINSLAMWTASDKRLSKDLIDPAKPTKDLTFNPFEVIKKILAPEPNDNKSINALTDLFFQDYQMGPLFVQENYLHVRPHASGGDPDAALTLMSKAADAIAEGDIVSRTIRSSNSWKLLTTQALYSCVLPGHYMRGNLTSAINFPSWLGKYSSRNRSKRLLQHLANHLRLPTGGIQPINLAMDSGRALLHHVTNPLIRLGSEGVNASLEAIQSYDLQREDLDLLAECTLWSHQKDPMSFIDSKTKAALTRAYNKSGAMMPYSLSTGATKKGRGGGAGKGFGDEGEIGDEGEVVEEANEDDDDLEKDAMVKASKKKGTTSKGNSKATKKEKVKKEERAPKKTKSSGKNK